MRLPTARGIVAGDTRCDPACIIEAGEHSAITARSCLFYARAHDESLARHERRLEKRQLRLGETASGALLFRMREGAARSQHIIFEHLQILIDQGLVN
jgi:hypothetical protein